jgi:feruloyl-CoA synthase
MQGHMRYSQGIVDMPLDPKQSPFVPTRFADRSPLVTYRDDGTIILGNAIAPDLRVAQTGVFLRRHAEHSPDAIFLAERQKSGDSVAWDRRSYGSIRRDVDAASQWLIDHGADGTRPVAILSHNSIRNAILQLAAMQIGVPVLALSPAYSLVSKDHRKLIGLIERFDPSHVFVEDTQPFAGALSRLAGLDGRLIAGASSGPFAYAVAFDDLTSTVPGPEVEARFSAVSPDSVARIMLTSGSTGDPKGVMVTQRMMLAVAEGFVTVWPFLLDRPPVMVDWLPWNHTAGANGSFNLMLRAGGALYIDDGKPTPGGIGRSVENLRSVAPTLMFNVPSAYDAVIPQMEQDPDFARHLLSNMDLLLYAAAGLPQNLWDRLEHLSIKVRGARIPIVSSLGSTETASPATLGWWGTGVSGSLGLPIPGIEAKLIKVNDEDMEVRFRGIGITPGYWGQPEATREAFDEEGFLRIGDAVRFSDPQNIAAGLAYHGRLSENFKLTTGIFVVVGLLRLDLIKACEPYVQDVVVAGENRSDIGLLVIPSPNAPAAPDSRAYRDALRQKIEAYNAGESGSSRRIARAIIMTEPPDIDAGEITDKGYLNQRRIIARRTALIETLYSDAPENSVMLFRR